MIKKSPTRVESDDTIYFVNGGLFFLLFASFSRNMKTLILTVLLCFCVNAHAFNWVGGN